MTDDQHNLANLLDAQMRKASIGEARLAKLVNSIADNPYFIHRSTIRNWRNGSSKTISNPRQLVTVAVALRLDETEANKLLASGGCPPIHTLRASTSEVDQALFTFWQQTPTQATPSTNATEEATNDSPSHVVTDTNTTKRPFESSGFKLTRLVSSFMLAVACITGIVGLVSSDYINLPFNIEFGALSKQSDDQSILPVVRKVKLGKQCLIDLALQPTGTVWGHGETPENCPELIIFHQYGDYSDNDLKQWDKSVAQCNVETTLERMWIAFNLPDGGEGWLRLTWFGKGAPTFNEDSPLTPTLWASPQPNSKIVGKYTYDELAGKASKVLLDFPERLDPNKAFEDGKFHLGGCWQAADRDMYKGIHFYWPSKTPLNAS